MFVCHPLRQVSAKSVKTDFNALIQKARAGLEIRTLLISSLPKWSSVAAVFLEFPQVSLLSRNTSLTLLVPNLDA